MATALQDTATRTGPEAPWVWDLIALATDLERASSLLENHGRRATPRRGGDDDA